MNPKCNYDCFLAILLLNTKETPRQKTVEKVFRKIALSIHPDKTKEQDREKSNRLMQQLVQAKNIIIKIISGQELYEDEVAHDCEEFKESSKIIRKQCNKQKERTNKQNDRAMEKETDNDESKEKIINETHEHNHEQQPNQKHSQKENGQKSEDTDEEVIYEGTYQKDNNKSYNTESNNNGTNNNETNNTKDSNNENYNNESNNNENYNTDKSNNNENYDNNNKRNNYQNAQIEKIISHHIKRRSLLFQVKAKGYELIINKNLSEALDNEKALKNYLNKLKNISKRRFNHLIRNYPQIMELYSTK